MRPARLSPLSRLSAAAARAPSGPSGGGAHSLLLELGAGERKPHRLRAWLRADLSFFCRLFSTLFLVFPLFLPPRWGRRNCGPVCLLLRVQPPAFAAIITVAHFGIFLLLVVAFPWHARVSLHGGFLSRGHGGAPVAFACHEPRAVSRLRVTPHRRSCHTALETAPFRSFSYFGVRSCNVGDLERRALRERVA